jgi:hypothetical protein
VSIQYILQNNQVLADHTLPEKLMLEKNPMGQSVHPTVASVLKLSINPM